MIWDLAQGKKVYELAPDDNQAIRSISVASDASMATAVTNKGNLFIWKWIKQTHHSVIEPVTVRQAHNPHCALKCLISPDCRYVATTSSDTTIKIWNPEDDFKLVRTLEGHKRWVWDCVFSADSEYLISVSSDNTARLWDVRSGVTARQYTGHHKAVVCIAMRDDS
mgnify:CR=1 FL=1